MGKFLYPRVLNQNKRIYEVKRIIRRRDALYEFLLIFSFCIIYVFFIIKKLWILCTLASFLVCNCSWFFFFAFFLFYSFASFQYVPCVLELQFYLRIKKKAMQILFLGYVWYRVLKKIWRIGYQRFAKIMIDLSLANLFYSFSCRHCNARFSPNVFLYRSNLFIQIL